MRTLSRRGFVAGLAALGAMALLPAGLLAQARPGRRLVLVFLRGGVDGLSVAAPYGDPAYATLRPTIALEPPGKDGEGNRLLDLDGFFGLHPALEPLLPWWSKGRLGFVHAAGSPDPSRSHFDAQAYMESGTAGKVTPDGWMNRLLTAMPGGGGAVRGLALGPTMPLILRGAAPASNMDLGRRAVARQQAMNSAPMAPEAAAAFDALYAADDQLGRAYRQGLAARRELLAGLDRENLAADAGASGPQSLADDAGRLAQLLAREPDIRLAFMPVGGWDTHVNQGNGKGQLAQRLRQLAQGLAALADGLGPALEQTLIVVLSEFGRTARENGNGGTDHGHGNVIWLLGGPIRGGKVHGHWPGLADEALNERRDLAVTTDYRHVLAAALTDHLGVPAARLGMVFPGLPRGAGPAGLLG